MHYYRIKSDTYLKDSYLEVLDVFFENKLTLYLFKNN